MNKPILQLLRGRPGCAAAAAASVLCFTGALLTLPLLVERAADSFGLQTGLWNNPVLHLAAVLAACAAAFQAMHSACMQLARLCADGSRACMHLIYARTARLLPCALLLAGTLVHMMSVSSGCTLAVVLPGAMIPVVQKLFRSRPAFRHAAHAPCLQLAAGWTFACAAISGTLFSLTAHISPGRLVRFLFCSAAFIMLVMKLFAFPAKYAVPCGHFRPGTHAERPLSPAANIFS